ARVRVARSTTVPDSGRRPPRRLRLHRRLVQPATPSFRARLSVAHDFRAVQGERRSHSDLRSHDRPRGCYLTIPLGGGTVTALESSSPSTEPGQLQCITRLVMKARLRT